MENVDSDTMNRRYYVMNIVKCCMAECVFDNVINVQNLISCQGVKFYVHNENDT